MTLRTKELRKNLSLKKVKSRKTVSEGLNDRLAAIIFFFLF